MVKARMNALDIRATVSNFRGGVADPNGIEGNRGIIGRRVANVYDINSRVYVFKLSGGESKEFLLLEAGIRVHLSEYKRDSNRLPSPFTMKLRKHLRTRRLESVTQLACDRIVQFSFGLRENAHHLLVELYVRGNIILTDANYRIISLLRSHEDDAVRTAVNEMYTVPHAQTALRDGLTEENISEDSVLFDAVSVELAALGARKTKEGGGSSGSLEGAQNYKRPNIYPQEKYHSNDILSRLLPFAHITLLDHSMRKALGDSAEQPSFMHLTEEEWVRSENLHILRVVIREALTVLRSVSRPGDQGAALIGTPPPQKFSYIQGWILCKEDNSRPKKSGTKVHLPAPNTASLDGDSQLKREATGDNSVYNGQNPPLLLSDAQQALDTNTSVPQTTFVQTDVSGLPPRETYSDFTPVLFPNHSQKCMRFPTFSASVDEFYSSAEVAKEEKVTAQKLSKAHKKLLNIKQDQERRSNQLAMDQQYRSRQAEVIEMNLTLVGTAIELVRAALKTGVSWETLGVFVSDQRDCGHAIARYIETLDAKNHTICMMLPVPESAQGELHNGNENREASQPIRVQIDYNISAYSNIEQLHGKRKVDKVKELKTIQQTDRVLKIAEKKASKDVSKVTGFQNQQVISKQRKNLWFEKFYWFITSDRYLVLAGRDATQNDVLYRRHLNKDDIYVHADTHGAASCIIKNHRSNSEIPVTSLSEAGQFSVCHSVAWKNKVIVSAWWVYPAQVSKTAPTGEYLVTGGFMVRGKKNYLPPVKLQMGLAVIFQLDNASIAIRRGEANFVEDSDDGGDDAELEINLPNQAGRIGDESGKQAELQIEHESGAKAANYQTETDYVIPVPPSCSNASKLDHTVLQVPDISTNNQNHAPPDTLKDSSSTVTQTPLPRGKRSKLKKFKAKYHDQDDKERELRMQLIGAKEIQLNPIARKTAKDAALEVYASFAAKEAVDKEAAEKARKFEAERDGSFKASAEQRKQTRSILDSLSGEPTAQDTFLAALPVCGPLPALLKYKYMTLLTPGSHKKGKVGALCIKQYIRQSAEDKESRLLKTLQVNDINQCMVNQVSVDHPAINDSLKQSKAGKKTK